MSFTILPAVVLVALQTPPTEVSFSGGNLRVEVIAAPLEFPWGTAYLPDGRLLITEKPGRLRILDAGKLSAPVAGVPTVAYRGQGGLLDVAVDPDFPANRFIYLSYAEAAARQPANARDPGDRRLGGGGGDAVLKGGAVARGRLEGNRLRDVRVIWRQTPKTIGRGHFGGHLAFGPDGKLWITSGDRMRFDPAQSRNGNLGKIVRINRDGTVPTDNPFAGSAIRDVWSIGHRNPLGIAVEPGTNRVWIHEMGPLGGDELNLIQRGKNYGWPIVSNGDNYDRSRIPDHETRPEFAKPSLDWTPVISPSGMVFYQGAMFPNWRGHALIGGLSSQALIRVSFRGGVPREEERIRLGRRIRDVIQAPDGSILLLTDARQGGLLRLSTARSR